MFFLSDKEYCKVIFPYEAQNDDELTIREGDVVTLISKVKAILFSYKQWYSFFNWHNLIAIKLVFVPLTVLLLNQS